MSEVCVIRIDEINSVKIASVSISGLKIKSPKSSNGFASEIGHLPIAMNSLMESNPIDTGKIVKIVWPNEGYDTWIKAVKEEKAGSWKIPLNQCVGAMESVLDK